jgi:hypothetical protein
MNLIFGLALTLGGIAAFYYSLPRKGKTARFVGTEWEGYVVVAMISAICVGLILMFAGEAVE